MSTFHLIFKLGSRAKSFSVGKSRNLVRQATNRNANSRNVQAIKDERYKEEEEEEEGGRLEEMSKEGKEDPHQKCPLTDRRCATRV
ncbi:hypothetical protein M8J75_011056 [Diaphorina citri]|nr:hypothetical protein M8J75_011056 [Diaphorina citri]